jgi:uncharacterized protein
MARTYIYQSQTRMEKTIGGHLVSGCKIYTTAEMIIGVFGDVVYKREFVEDSGYEELVVYNK